MKRIFYMLYDTDQSVGNYVWKAALIAVIPTLILSSILALAIRIFQLSEKSPSFDGSTFSLVIVLGVITPWVETLLMIPVFWALKRFIHKNLGIAFASAAFWAVLHSLQVLGWGFVIWWSFLVLSICFLEWEKKSKKQAILATASIHMCQNLIALLGVLLTT